MILQEHHFELHYKMLIIIFI